MTPGGTAPLRARADGKFPLLGVRACGALAPLQLHCVMRDGDAVPVLPAHHSAHPRIRAERAKCRPAPVPAVYTMSRVLSSRGPTAMHARQRTTSPAVVRTIGIALLASTLQGRGVASSTGSHHSGSSGSGSGRSGSSSSSSSMTPDAPMSLQELASDWLPSPAAGPRDFPELSNFHGSTGVAREAVGLARSAMPPFVCTASDFPGDKPWLLIDGRAPDVTHTRWTAYEAGRRSTVVSSGATVTIESATRMQFEGRYTMVHVVIDGAPGTLHNVSLGLRGLARKLQKGLGWSVPYPTQADISDFSFSMPYYTAKDNRSDALSMYAITAAKQPHAMRTTSNDELPFRAEFGKVLLPFSFGFTWLVGNDTTLMRRDAELFATSDGFWTAWNASQTLWERRWLDAFTPKLSPEQAGHHSGNLPLMRSDDLNVRRVYYMAALTLLAVQRTNSPQHPRVYFTGGQGTAQFFWDSAQHAYMQTLLDPTSMRAQIAAALKTDWRLYYGVNIDDGAVIGNYYAFDALSIFTQLDAYLRLTNDTAFLLSNLSGVPVPAMNDPWINPSLNPQPGRSSGPCGMEGSWKPPGLEQALLFSPYAHLGAALTS